MIICQALHTSVSSGNCRAEGTVTYYALPTVAAAVVLESGTTGETRVLRQTGMVDVSLGRDRTLVGVHVDATMEQAKIATFHQ